MSNSSLVDCTVLSPNHSGKRTHAIDRITPHCVVGQLSAESIGGCFKSRSVKASCNYGIGTEGRVCLVVDEGNRSWCTSSNENDQRAITIECASDLKSPYAFNDSVYNKLIELTVEIMRRHNKTKLVYIADKATALRYEPKENEMLVTWHRWYANKECPGNWMVSKATDYVNKVNTALAGGESNNTGFNVGDVVKLKSNATQYDWKAIKSDYKDKEYTIKEIKGDRVVLTINNVVIYAVNIDSLVGTESKFPYTVRITADVLNVRSGPSVQNNVTTTVRKNEVYTIVDEDGGWGKLKSGAGWISLAYTEKR